MEVGAIEPPEALEAPPSLTGMVREALEELDGKKDKAIDRVFYRLRADQKLLRAIVADAVKIAVESAVQKGVMTNRREIVRAHETRQSRGNVLALAEGLSNALLDFPLAGGKKLRDATRGEVLAQVDTYESSAKGMLHKARWLRLIAQAIPADKTVGDALQEQRVSELYEEAKNDKH